MIEEPPDKTAKQIYDELIARCRAYVKSRTSSVFDPNTGILKTFIAGKLMHTQQINTPRGNNGQGLSS